MANFLFSSKNKLTPKLKFEAYINAPFFFLQISTASVYLSNQPVVPETTGILLLKQMFILLNASDGILKSIATSALEISLLIVSTSILATIS